MLKEICTISNAEQPDDFVGLRFTSGKPSVVFPRGYRLPTEDDNLRREIIRLIATINRFSGRHEGENPKNNAEEIDLKMPVQSYQYVIYDFLAHGYYTENEVRYMENNRGKISWKRTIQKEQPAINNGNVVYLNFITKVNQINESSIITRIHEYCVFESFQKLGWLFLGKDVKPKKPTIKLNRKAFIGILRKELGKTFNIQKKQLFQSMINIIAQTDEKIDDHFNAAFGVYRFEYIWEGLIDYVFGEANKEDYFPHASWHIIKGSKHESSALEPDTIMLFNGKTYILDAKYYKYGVTGNPLHLPGTSSIQKQITYGDYVAEHSVAPSKIYNAFIMPFDCCGEAPYKFVSVGTVDWINYSPATEAYKYVLGILLDTSHVINTFAKHNMSEIEDLSRLIELSAKEYLTTLYGE